MKIYDKDKSKIYNFNNFAKVITYRIDFRIMYKRDFGNYP